MTKPNGDAYEYSRCNKYGTTIYSCKCKGYSFRKACRHVDFLRGKLAGNQGDKCEKVTNDCEAVAFVERHGEQMLNRMKLLGDVFEKHGRLYVLE